MNEDNPGSAVTRAQYGAIAAFRFELRRFLAFSEAAAAAAGVPPQQHQALLTVAGLPAETPATVGYLAEQLVVAPHTAAELVNRMVDASLLTKAPSTQDRRRVELSLTPKADELLHRLTTAHLRELRTLEPALTRALRRLNKAQTSTPC